MGAFCCYYRAQIIKHECVYFISIFRSFDHMAFDRTFDAANSIFEFFVPQEMEQKFLEIMEYFIQAGVVTNLRKMENRLIDSAQVV